MDFLPLEGVASPGRGVVTRPALVQVGCRALCGDLVFRSPVAGPGASGPRGLPFAPARWLPGLYLGTAPGGTGARWAPPSLALSLGERRDLVKIGRSWRRGVGPLAHSECLDSKQVAADRGPETGRRTRGRGERWEIQHEDRTDCPGSFPVGPGGRAEARGPASRPANALVCRGARADRAGRRRRCSAPPGRP